MLSVDIKLVNFMITVFLLVFFHAIDWSLCYSHPGSQSRRPPHRPARQRRLIMPGFFYRAEGIALRQLCLRPRFLRRKDIRSMSIKYTKYFHIYLGLTVCFNCYQKRLVGCPLYLYPEVRTLILTPTLNGDRCGG